jgi:putative sterol carrier protein
MSLDSLAEQMKSQAAMNPPLGYRVKFDLGDDGVLVWDGTVTPPEIATNEDGGAAEPDTVLRLSLDDLGKLLSGTLDPTLAYMTGKLKIQGSRYYARS